MASNPAYFYRRTRDARKVLVVDLGFLGDTVHLVPALWELKSGYPQAALHVLTSTVGAEVLQLAPCVAQAWGLEMYPEKRTLRQQWAVLKQLRRERVDAAFIFSASDRNLFTTALTGARWRVAQPWGRWHFYNPWLVPNWVPRQDPNRIVYEQRRQMLADCGLPLGPVRFDLQVDEASARWAKSTVPAAALHISVNSAKPTREWSLEHHVTLLRNVWADQPGLQVVVSGAAKPRERDRIRSLAAEVNDPRLQILPETMSIAQLAAVLKRCSLHIGPDSGVLHLAVALGLPTISFFREQGSYQSFMPVGPNHRVISMPCGCIDGHSAPCESLGRAECFARIEPARVAALVREQLAATRPH
jgi:ADP-heptose:LPS heptosyltransferase